MHDFTAARLGLAITTWVGRVLPEDAQDCRAASRVGCRTVPCNPAHRLEPPAQALGIDCRPGLLDTRENQVRWAGPALQLSYSSDKCTYLERGILASGDTFVQKPLGAGRVLYFALPLELSDDLRAIGEVYRFALNMAKVRRTYTTEVQDPGILICPTRLGAATLYVLTSESSSPQPVSFQDLAAGKSFQCRLNPGRAALALIRQGGELAASYNW